jgi:hypothetical protein
MGIGCDNGIVKDDDRDNVKVNDYEILNVEGITIPHGAIFSVSYIEGGGGCGFLPGPLD